MRVRTFRTINRAAHLVGAAALAVFIYSPWGADEGFRMAMQLGIVPALTVSGLLMWKPARGLQLLGLRAPARVTEEVTTS